MKRNKGKLEMSNFEKAKEIKRISNIGEKIIKESENTEIESLSLFGFLLNFNCLGDLNNIKFELQDKYKIDLQLGEQISRDLEKTIKKIIGHIKTKRTEISSKYQKQIDIKKGFRGY